MENWNLKEGGELTDGNSEVKQWLKTVTEERYNRASVLEKILRYSRGGTNHKMLIDNFLQGIEAKPLQFNNGNNLVYLSDEMLASWKAFLEEQEKERIEREKKEANLAKMKADPNYEKYRDEICKNGYRETDFGFEMLFYLHKQLEETPKEELEKQFEEIRAKGIGSEGPTVDEYFQGMNPQYQYQKGYSEGAKILMEKVIQRLSEDERPLIPSDEIIALMRFIYEKE